MTKKIDRTDVKYAEFGSSGAVIVWAVGSEILDYDNEDELKLAQRAFDIMQAKINARDKQRAQND